MKILNKILLILFVSIAFNTAMAQKGSNCPEDLIPRKSENKQYGFVTLFGEWRITPIYTKVSPFRDNKAIVMKGLVYGVIDCDGNVLIPPQFEMMSNFRSGKAWAKKGGLWGLVDERGKVLIEFQYSEINPIADTDLSWVKKDNLWGLVGEERGNIICKPQFKIAQVLSENATLVQQTELFGVINHVNCGYLIPAQISKVKKIAQHTILYKQNNHWGLFSELGKILLQAEYDSIYALDEDLLVIKKGGKYGLASITGKEVLPLNYEEIGELGDGYIPVKSGGKWGYSNRLGKVYIAPAFEEAYAFKNRKAVVKSGGLYGIIDFAGKFIQKPQYAKVRRNFSYDYFAIAPKDKFYLYTSQLVKMLETGFDSVSVVDSVSFTRAYKDGKVSFFNVPSKSQSFPGEFEEAGELYRGFFKVKQNGKWGIIDTKGKSIVPTKFDSVEFDYCSVRLIFKVTQNGLTGVYDQSGKEILAPVYDFVTYAAPLFKVKKNGAYGLYKTSGEVVTEPVFDYLSNKKEEPLMADWPAIFGQKQKFGLINEKGEELLPAKATKILPLAGTLFAVNSGKAFGLFNTALKNEPEYKYDELTFAGNNMVAARKGNKWGVLDNTGKVLVKPEYEEFKAENGQSKFLKDGKWYILGRGGVLK
ncbi:WG repeat-containing protein [Sporocytophaga myxococcoides]|uniref:WG repeat-containing protein n=1 Tax=Sporocytophaga myxococcoides TaxID=153721 RepID=UPI0003FC5B82|nr:WG repeat-containing protein [Sporocytophaga myxococcoides]